MVVVKLMGGLGNQMFQYAAAKRLSVTHNVPLIIDTSRLDTIIPGETKREYGLGAFNISAGLNTIPRDIILSGNKPLVNKILQLVRPNNYYFMYGQHKQKFNKDVLYLPKNTYLEGEFQSEKYFVDAKKQIKAEFTLRSDPNMLNKKVLDQVKSGNSVSLHVRRGDYITNKNAQNVLGNLQLEYYQKAVEYLSKKFPDIHLYVFSDDISWCKSNLKLGTRTHFVDNGNDGAEDLRLMTSCKHHIIANSSLSWWGAWLGDSLGGVTIAPKRWFVDKTFSSKDLIPEDWIQL